MSKPLSLIPARIDVTVPESCRVVLTELCVAKGITAGEAVNEFVLWACRGLKERGLKKDSDLADDLDLFQEKRRETLARADQILSTIEGHLLDSRALATEINRRIAGIAK